MPNLILARSEQIAPKVFALTLSGDVSLHKAPGQFVNIRLDGFFLRRPISVCDVSDNALTVVYKVVGDGTLALSKKRRGDALDVLVGLGNGFDAARPGERPLLVGGGLGVPPLFTLAKALCARGKQPTALLGFGTAGEAILIDRFRALGIPVVVTTADGSLGQMGLVTDALPRIYADLFYACGPIPMLRALCERTPLPGELSFEARMACGFGACMGCSMPTKDGMRRVCADGPVFDKDVIVW